MEVLLNILDDLDDDQLSLFQWYLQKPNIVQGLPGIKKSRLQTLDRCKTVDVMVQTYGLQGAVQVTRVVLEKILRNDLLQRFPASSSGPGVHVSDVGKTSENRERSSSQTQASLPQTEDSCQLTVDTNTVNRHLKLSDNNRKVTYVMKDQSYPDHPDRFDYWEQLLCRTGLTGCCHWEVEWRGEVEISVSYRGIRRRGFSNDCVFGCNDQSWSLICSDLHGYSVSHNNRETPIRSSSVSHRVSVYVDVPAGTLSFYRVSSDSLILLHTFNTIFTEPLYPGFGVWWPGSSVFLC
ncbi:stonustoxin subunit alpha-like [Amphiprion ocellaris]|uniref:stonustoxin subunit alpha-like n=1 Tax=Amphiprion ocellaris TaxID=80972 RepID=UPI002410C873|nr:stonustoxin subunit alpha-like [Amphiprion ocellaris]